MQGMLFGPPAWQMRGWMGQALSFTTQPSESGSFQEVSISNPAFERLTVTTIDGPVTATATWARQSNGTETYVYSDSHGDEKSYTEHSDCSGHGHAVRHNERGLFMTNDFSWSSAALLHKSID